MGEGVSDGVSDLLTTGTYGAGGLACPDALSELAMGKFGIAERDARFEPPPSKGFDHK